MGIFNNCQKEELFPPTPTQLLKRRSMQTAKTKRRRGEERAFEERIEKGAVWGGGFDKL